MPEFRLIGPVVNLAGIQEEISRDNVMRILERTPRYQKVYQNVTEAIRDC
jgi:hypothetical protein